MDSPTPTSPTPAPLPSPLPSSTPVLSFPAESATPSNPAPKRPKPLTIILSIALTLALIGSAVFFLLHHPSLSDISTDSTDSTDLTDPDGSSDSSFGDYGWYTLSAHGDLITFTSVALNVSFDFPSSWRAVNTTMSFGEDHLFSALRSDGFGVDFSENYGGGLGGDCDLDAPDIPTTTFYFQKATALPGLNVVVHDSSFYGSGFSLYVSTITPLDQPVPTCPIIYDFPLRLMPDDNDFVVFGASPTYSDSPLLPVSSDTPNLSEIINVLASLRKN